MSLTLTSDYGNKGIFKSLSIGEPCWLTYENSLTSEFILITPIASRLVSSLLLGILLGVKYKGTYDYSTFLYVKRPSRFGYSDFY